MTKLKKRILFALLLLCFFFLPLKLENTNQNIHIKVCTDGIFVYLYNYGCTSYPKLNVKYSNKPMVNLNCHNIFAIYLNNAHDNFSLNKLKMKVTNDDYVEFFMQRNFFYINDIEQCLLEYVDHTIIDEYSTLKSGDPCLYDNLCKSNNIKEY